MIPANELRIGNLVEEEILGNVRVHEILHNSVWVVCKHMNVDRTIEERSCKLILSDIKPIPLTPEILEKAGYVTKLIGGLPYYKLLKFEFLNGSLIPGGINFMSMDMPCEYVHQLQNLYFALTGNELEIEL
jgi:hypothetical protein